ncbi:MAG: exported protein of unknown function, partial [Gemmatimonadetes bacterium]|nr:exported protein of unknown function [Gemmatimonadota bacterium]
PPPGTLAALECRADVAARRVECGGAGLPAGVHADQVFGGQGVNVLLTSTNVGYNAGTQIFSADVTVKNLLVQRLGTSTGTDTAGIKVFFAADPAVTAGSGTVSVENADGYGLFTSVNQGYFWYHQVLPWKAVSAVKHWRWSVSPGVTGFTFKVYVSTPVLPVVVFDRLVAGNLDVYRVALDGGDTVRLSTTLTDEFDPTASHGKVVFVGYQDGDAELYSMPLTGGAPTRLTNSFKITESDPALSPDGSKLAYITDVSGVGKVWTMNVDGTGAARSTAGFSFSGSIEVTPSWFSNDRLAFVSTDLGSGDIYGMTLGSLPSLLVGGSSADLQPAVSPDGGRVAFISNRDGDTEIYLYTVSTHAITRLTNRVGTDAQPAWLSDKVLVYTVFVGSTPHLEWMEPATPGVSHVIPTGPGNAQRPSAVLF